MKATIAFLYILCIAIWFYLLHEILIKINASEICWFLYWVYMPCNLIVAILAEKIRGEINATK